MKLFTLDEANALLADIAPKLAAIKNFYEQLGNLRDDAREAAASAHAGGGMRGGTHYVSLLYEIGRLTTDLGEIGVELKDYSRGLIDFPSLKGGRVVYLCWQLGDGEELEWWHETDAGFGGRQPL